MDELTKDELATLTLIGQEREFLWILEELVWALEETYPGLFEETTTPLRPF